MTEFNQKIGVIGCGFVGTAMIESLSFKGLNCKQYDKYKNGGIGKLSELLSCDILFLCLPTMYSEELKEYDKSAIYEVCDELSKLEYAGIVVVKSTIEIGTTSTILQPRYNLRFVHNPEFLSAKTAVYDFHNQTHIVLGNANDHDIGQLIKFYETFYSAQISLCTSDESEAMKLACNCFYSVKIQYFNEIYLLCENMDVCYNKVKDLMLKNGWINPMHTRVPGTDGQLSYGGFCFPKDTNALKELMKRQGTLHGVLDSAIQERNLLRDDNLNCLKK